jgi:hypothetical protein
MGVIILILIIIHAIIHLLGFIKAFGYAEIKTITSPVSKPMGVVWLIAFLIIIVAGILFAFKIWFWWMPMFAGILISQLVIFPFWKDARFGTIANGILLVVALTAFGKWNFENKYEREVSSQMNRMNSDRTDLLTEMDIMKLPVLVQKYIRYAGAVNKPKIRNFKIEFTGKIRKNEQSEWMPFVSEQYNFMETSTRLFFMKATMRHLPVEGFHSFMNGSAFMDIRLFSLLKVQYQSGREMGIAETVTFFNDMCCMAPGTLIDSRIKWLDQDSLKVKASFSNNGITITAWLYFNPQGQLVNFISNNRYATQEDGTMLQLPWQTPISSYRNLNGYNLPSYAEAIYHYPKGDFCYGTFTIRNIDYNYR